MAVDAFDVLRGERELQVGIPIDKSARQVNLIDHDGGVADWPGLYTMGLPFMRRRKSALIDGAGDDARFVTSHLATFLDGTRDIRRFAAA